MTKQSKVVVDFAFIYDSADFFMSFDRRFNPPILSLNSNAHQNSCIVTNSQSIQAIDLVLLDFHF